MHDYKGFDKVNHTQRTTMSDPYELTVIFRRILDDLSSKFSSRLGNSNLFINMFGFHLETEKEQKKAITISAAYLLLAQMIVYRILSEKRCDLPKVHLNSFNTPNDLARFLKKALRLKYDPIFSINIIKDLDDSTFKHIKDSIKVIINMKPELLQYEIIALIFNNLIPLSLRKQIGAYYSGIKTARLLSHFAISIPSVKVLDPACGSGALLVSAYRRKKELLKFQKGTFSIEDHRRFLSSDITGLDVMPFAVHLSAIHLSLQSPFWNINQNRLAVCDSTFVTPNTKVTLLSHIINDEIVINIPKQITLDFVDLVIMNPPFVRQETLNKIRMSYKDELEKAFSEYSPHFDKKMGYHCYFIFLADRFLKPGGKLAVIIPASFLRIDTTLKIRKWLMKHYQIQYIICQRDKPNFSENTAFREVVLIAKKKASTKKITYIIIQDLESKEFPENILNQGKIPDLWEERKVSSDKVSSNNLFLPIATMSKFDLNEKWKVITKHHALIKFDVFLRSKGIECKRGIETSRGFKIQNMVLNDFGSNYLQPRDIWISDDETQFHVNAVNRHSRVKIKIPKMCVHLHLRRVTGEKRLDISNKREFVVTSSFSQFKEFIGSEEKGSNAISSINLKDWRTYVEERLTHLMIARRFDISASGTFLFSFFSKQKRAPPGVMWSFPSISMEDAKVLCLFFNSTINLLQIFLNRVETRGAWMQLHEYVVKDIEFPDICSWTDEQRLPYYDLFEKLKDKEFPPIWQQLAMNVPVSEINNQDFNLLRNQFPNFENIVGVQFKPRKILDLLILKSLNFENSHEFESLLGKIYQGLLIEIAILKKMMK
ncbi:MAG: class I SAM-dependent DNA methyltransferase [Promethearchaeota archaeon]